jgi:hypothetical protein
MRTTTRESTRERMIRIMASVLVIRARQPLGSHHLRGDMGSHGQI